MKKKLISLALSLSMMSSVIPGFTTASAAEPIVAFPGAEGAGKYATGGRGGTVYHVTNLNDSGAGSFRDAVSHTGRIIVFDVGGTINLKSDVVVKGNNTIAGQTAPGGGGITLRGGKIGMGGDNIIIRFVSSRPGENGSSECDAWGGDKGSNSIIDHCSIGWANDEQFGLYSSMQQTVQYSLIGPSNCISYHAKGAHGFGIMMGAGHNSWHHNMIAHNISRNFRGKIGGKNTLDYVNNVIFNWGYQTAYGTFGQVNYVGNYFKKGLSTNGGHRYISINSGTAPENYRFYLVGNKMVNSDGTDYNTAMNTDNWVGVDYGNAGLTQADYQVNSPLRVNDVNGNDASVVANAQTADEAFETVLAYAGAGIRADLRPKIDQQVMEEARTGNGYLTGGRDFSTLTSSDTDLNDAIAKYNIKEMNYDEYYPQAVTQKEIVDTDNDGMPDEWELARGLNPNANDAMGDYLSQGYNNIEYYINDLTVDAFPEGVVTVSPEIVDLGEDYTNAKADSDALKLSPTTIEKVSDLTLPVKGAKGSVITWSSSSSAIVIKDNKISAVNRPASGNASVTLTASVSNGNFTLKRSFVITVRQIPYNFDFGNGSVQNSYTAVTSSTIYSDDTGYGFTASSQSAITKAPANIPSGYNNLHADQIEGATTFRTKLPNGSYTVIIHYGASDSAYGTRYNVEGVDSGALASTNASQYVARVKVTDGVLDVGISAGDKSKGGYINGLEIVTTPSFKYKFDFGDGTAQSGFTAVPASTEYSYSTGYGFSGTLPEGMERAPGNIPSGYDNLHADQINGVTEFKADVPNGTYIVVIHYGCWNTGFGTNYTVEGVSSGNLAATDAAQYVTEVEITDGVLNVAINKGTKSYGGYINGLEILTPPEPQYHFDFGDGAAQSGYVGVPASTVYSSATRYGFADSTSQSSMERAPGNIPSGYDNLHADQISGVTTFKSDLPNGKYLVTVHYGSWNTNFGTNYTIEGVSSGNLAATDAAQYVTKVDVTDGVLDVVINAGNKSYGGYINGMDITPLQKLPYHFDFGDGDVQSGYTAVTSSTVYSELFEYGFEGTALSAMTRAPGGIEAGFENLHNDQLNGEGKFKANIPNGKYNVIIHYGSWNEGFGTNYTVEGVSSGNLAATNAAQYSTTVDVTDGMLDVVIAKGSKSYGGYINGMDVIQIASAPDPTPTPTVKPTATPTPTVKPTVTPTPTVKPTMTPTPTVKPTATPTPTVKPTATPTPTVKPTATPTTSPVTDISIDVTYTPSGDGFVATGTYRYISDSRNELMAILAVYDEIENLVCVKVENIIPEINVSGNAEITGIAADEGYIIKGMFWQKDNMHPLADAVRVVIDGATESAALALLDCEAELEGTKLISGAPDGTNALETTETVIVCDIGEKSTDEMIWAMDIRFAAEDAGFFVGSGSIYNTNLVYKNGLLSHQLSSTRHIGYAEITTDDWLHIELRGHYGTSDENVSMTAYKYEPDGSMTLLCEENIEKYRSISTGGYKNIKVNSGTMIDNVKVSLWEQNDDFVA